MKLCLTFLLFVAFAAISFAAPYFESDDVAVEPTSGIEKFTFDDEFDQEVFTLEDLEGDDDDEDTDDDNTDDGPVYSHEISGQDDSNTDLEALTLEDLEDDDSDSEQWHSDVTVNELETGLEEFSLKGLSDEEIENYGIGSIIGLIPKIIKGIKGGTKIIKGIKGGVKAVKGSKGNTDGTFPATKTRKKNVVKGNNKPQKGNNKGTKGKGKSTKGNKKGSKGIKKGSKGTNKGSKGNNKGSKVNNKGSKGSTKGKKSK